MFKVFKQMKSRVSKNRGDMYPVNFCLLCAKFQMLNKNCQRIDTFYLASLKKKYLFFFIFVHFFAQKQYDSIFVIAKQMVLESLNKIRLNQASFDHVKVRPTPVLSLHNLLRQIHMFLDILELRVENKNKNSHKKLFW